MSKRSKSGVKRKRHLRVQRHKRAWKRKRAALIAAGKMKKGLPPVSHQP